MTVPWLLDSEVETKNRGLTHETTQLAKEEHGTQTVRRSVVPETWDARGRLLKEEVEVSPHHPLD